jgi:hypothetical protein
MTTALRRKAEQRRGDLREQAVRQYEYCREGIEKYDEHLFRIRQWSIGLTAVMLAAVLGLAQSDGMKGFEPPLALFAFTAINFAFWLLDALNKSLQTVHIHNSRDTERFLRGTDPHFLGPTISLRFQRKEKRHWVGTVKNLTDETVILFHALPLAVFWSAILYKFRKSLCFDGIGCGGVPYERWPAIGLLLIVLFLLLMSWRWKHGRRIGNWVHPASKFFFRPRAAARYRMFCTIHKELHKDTNGDAMEPCRCSDIQRLCKCSREYPEKLLSPFRADFHNSKNNTLLFIDRCKIFRDPQYLNEREKCLKLLGYKTIHIEWDKKWPRLWRPVQENSKKIEEFRNAVR